ncbi:noggin-3 [Syngnathoides biaculeatus]|uniref:noggin-3 n=1 Tax=Syngnathoides biaculeatus TaxID=300417 RepID=UPI002ADDC0A8|nr:noggin-3 [Syngnathoides biaculeatus]
MAPRWLPCLLVVWTLLLARARCQHYLLLRPVPSEHLPLVELKEDPDPLLDPREKDLNETELRGALGGHFDARFMSVLPPSSPEHEDPRDRDREAAGSPESDPHALDSGGKKQKPSRNLRRRLQMWLRSYAACPVLRAWTDVGVRFWPRYVKTGRCPDERSCSVPEGMRCAPAKAEHLTLLRWRCVRRKAARKCAWIPVQYPVVSECRCSCAT